jgi:hypothetical protein
MLLAQKAASNHLSIGTRTPAKCKEFSRDFNESRVYSERAF